MSGRKRLRNRWGKLGLCLALVLTTAAWGEQADPPAQSSPAERGLWLLLNKRYMARDVTAAEFEELWKVWPEPMRTKAEAATPPERRRMTYSRYGLIDFDSRSLPMGLVDDGANGWGLNCLICHGGKVEGRAIPGLPNSHLAFQTWVQDVVEYRVQFENRSRSEFMQSLAVPLGRSNGTTNAQIFSVVFTTLRDSDLNMKSAEGRRVPKMLHHDLDPPPFWNLKKKKMMYIDGYVEKSPRVIMQFVLHPSNRAETIKSWEQDFRDILAFAEQTQAPKYGRPVDQTLAEKGRVVFEANCAECHGKYGPGGTYPEKTVPIDDIGTDRRRFDGMPIEHRRFFEQGWMGEEGEVDVVEKPVGYVAPPLNGVWASAPYLHNGSVPTLWHLLHPGDRPPVWKRTEDGYDHAKVGLEVNVFDRVPAEVKHADERRTYFDTALPGKSAAGHDYPNALNESEKQMVLEYLKTL